MIWDCHVHLQLLATPCDLATAMVPTDYCAVSCASSPDEWESLAELYNCMPTRIVPVFGVHPELAAIYSAELASQLQALLRRIPCAWVGETGLDRRFPLEAQMPAFQAQAAIALALVKPLVLHCVGKFAELHKVLKQVGFGPQTAPIVLHRYTGSIEVTRQFLADFNCYFSLHSDSLRSKGTWDALQSVPQTRWLVETDADQRFGADLSTDHKIQKLQETLLSMNAHVKGAAIASNLEQLCARPGLA